MPQKVDSATQRVIYCATERVVYCGTQRVDYATQRVVYCTTERVDYATQRVVYARQRIDGVTTVYLLRTFITSAKWGASLTSSSHIYWPMNANQ